MQHSLLQYYYILLRLAWPVALLPDTEVRRWWKVWTRKSRRLCFHGRAARCHHPTSKVSPAPRVSRSSFEVVFACFHYHHCRCRLHLTDGRLHIAADIGHRAAIASRRLDPTSATALPARRRIQFNPIPTPSVAETSPSTPGLHLCAKRML